MFKVLAKILWKCILKRNILSTVYKFLARHRSVHRSVMQLKSDICKKFKIDMDRNNDTQYCLLATIKHAVEVELLVQSFRLSIPLDDADIVR